MRNSMRHISLIEGADGVFSTVLDPRDTFKIFMRITGIAALLLWAERNNRDFTQRRET